MRTKAQAATQNQLYHQRHRTAILARQARNRAAQKTGPNVRLWTVKKLLADAKRRATKKGLEFSLRPSDIQTPDTCPIFGIELEWSRPNAKRAAASPSLDRIDSRIGYVPSNVWIISWRANQIKGASDSGAEREVKTAAKRPNGAHQRRRADEGQRRSVQSGAGLRPDDDADHREHAGHEAVSHVLAERRGCHDLGRLASRARSREASEAVKHAARVGAVQLHGSAALAALWGVAWGGLHAYQANAVARSME